jgi:CO/xanthine dehydrogenase FAD-binding subunit
LGLYVRPSTLEGVLAELAQQPATIAAGRTDLFALTVQRALPGDIADITGVETLHGITRGASGVRIGADAG